MDDDSRQLFESARALVDACIAADTEKAEFALVGGWRVTVERWDRKTDGQVVFIPIEGSVK